MFLLVSLLLFINWLVFSGKYDPLHVGLGVVCSLLVAWFSGPLLFTDSKRTLGSYVKMSLRMPRYFLWLLGQIFVSNLHVLKIVFHPRMEELLNPRVLQFKANEIDNGFAAYILANSITLTPGTVTMNAEDGVFTVHALSAVAAESLPEPMLSKVARNFNR